MIRPLVHRGLRAALRAAVAVYYREVRVIGAGSLPTTGPLLIVANHPNSLVDPFLVLLQFREKVHFMARSGTMTNALQAYLFDAFGVVPVWRKDEADTSERQRRNETTFRRCREILGRGGIVALFPEGYSHADPRLYKVRTGAARILLEAEAEHACGLGAAQVPVSSLRSHGQLGVRLLPLGLDYRHGARFRSDVEIAVGRPVDTTPALSLHRSDPRAAVEALTGSIRQAILECFLVIDTREEAELLRRLEALYSQARELPPRLREDDPEAPAGPESALESPAEPAPAGPVERRAPERVRHERLLRFADGYRRFRRESPERVEALAARLRRYFNLTDALGLPELEPLQSYSAGRVLRFLGLNLPLFALGLPLYAWGLANHLFPLFASRLAGRFAGAEDRVATFRLYAGLMALPLAWSFQTAAVWWAAGPAWALAYAASLPPAGLFALGFRETRRDTGERIRAFFVSLSRRGLTARLDRERRTIIDEVNELAREYRRRWKGAKLEDEAEPKDPFAGKA